MAIEKTLVLIKPDGRKRRITGLAIDKLEATGLELVAARVVRVTPKLAREHYQEHAAQPFFNAIVQYLEGKTHSIEHGRLLAMVWEGEDAIAAVRRAAGATDPEKAAPGTIRGCFGRKCAGLMENVVHASSNPADAAREIALWFNPSDIA